MSPSVYRARLSSYLQAHSTAGLAALRVALRLVFFFVLFFLAAFFFAFFLAVFFLATFFLATFFLAAFFFAFFLVAFLATFLVFFLAFFFVAFFFAVAIANLTSGWFREHENIRSGLEECQRIFKELRAR